VTPSLGGALARRSRTLLAGAALLAPVAYAAYLAPFGIRGSGGDTTAAALVAVVALYALPLACLGAGLVVAVGRGHHATVVVAVGGLLSLPFVVPSGLDSLPRVGIAVSMLAAGVGLVAAAEYAVRYPRRVLTEYSAVAIGAAGIVGVVHAAVVLWVVGQQYAAVVDALGLWLVWGAVGTAALGALPTLLVLRYSLVTPGFVVGVLTANAVRTDLFAAPVDSVTPMYLVVWFLVLPVVVAVGAVEFLGRRHLGPLRPRSLVGGRG
jgi:hypothetical protein